MSWLTAVIGKVTGGMIEDVGSVVDKFHTSTEEKMAMKLELTKVMQAHELALQDTLQTEIKAKESVMLAELNQSDNYTKRARPTIIYGGLLMIFLNHVLAPFLFGNSGTIAMPPEFWYVWGGVCGVYILGRSGEKMGLGGKLGKASGMITGNGKEKAGIL